MKDMIAMPENIRELPVDLKRKMIGHRRTLIALNAAIRST